MARGKSQPKESDPREALALALCQKYATDMDHARHVARLADQLFEAFSPLHGLGPDARAHLRDAALVHDIGTFVVGVPRHHRMTERLVRSDVAMAEYPKREREFVARLARNHRRTPKAGPSSWTTDERQALTWLSAILRVADVLDFDHAQEASLAGIDAKGSGFEIRLKGLDPKRLGRHLEEKSDLLEEMLGGPLRFRKTAQ